MSVLLLGVLGAAIAVPHALPRRALDPATAASLWVVNLSLRAAASVLAALLLVLYLPSTALFAALTHWCWHAVLPLHPAHLGVNGHEVGDTAAVLPALVLALSVGWAGAGLARVARSVRRLVRRHTLGRGPHGSLVVGGPDVVLAAAGLTQPRVLVSTGALTQLDDEELAAGLDHERGHIVRHHRWILAYGQLCRALGVFVPGSRAALGELSLHLERDADRFALARRHDRFALASAILKAAGVVRPAATATALGGSRAALVQRLTELVEVPATPRRPGPRRLVLAGCLVAVAASAASVPPVVAAGLERPAAARHVCGD